MTSERYDIVFAHGASQGRRARQEDHCKVWQPGKLDPGIEGLGDTLVVLADGMGGHTSGQIASRTACTGFIRAFAAQGGGIGARLASALSDANSALAERITEDNSLSGMGSTIVAAYVDDEALRWASVGDSTLLLYRDGVLQRLNADHSHGAILDQQAAAGIISEEIARTDTRRRALHSALTGDPIPLQDLELQGFELMPGDWVLIASDGLLTLQGDEIATIIHDHSDSLPGELVAALLTAVEARNEPNQDNTTVAALRIAPPGTFVEEEVEVEGVDQDGKTITHVMRTRRGAETEIAPEATPRGSGGSALGVLLGLVVVAIVAVLAWLYLAPLIIG